HQSRIQWLRLTADGAPCRVLGFEVVSASALTQKENRLEDARDQLRRVAAAPRGILDGRALIAGFTMAQLTCAAAPRCCIQKALDSLETRRRAAFNSKGWSGVASGPIDTLVRQRRTFSILQDGITFVNQCDGEAILELDMSNNAVGRQLRAAWRAKQRAVHIGIRDGRFCKHSKGQRPWPCSIATGDFITVLT
ncbi:unnamed protein product, partial [Prorocentrum cordatum]